MKKIIALLTALCLLMALAVPVFAVDPKVDEVMNEYAKMNSCFESGDYEGYLNAYTAIGEISAEFDEAQSEEFIVALEEAEISIEDYLTVLFETAMIIYTLETRDAYISDPNAYTAYEFTAAYTEMENGFITGAELEEKFAVAAENLQSDYSDALADLPSDKVLALYEEYPNFSLSLFIGIYDEDFIDSYNTFKDAMDTLDTLTEDEKEQLTAMLELSDFDEIESEFQYILNQGNIIIQLGEPYNEYCEDPTEETAKAFIEIYDEVFSSEENILEYEDITDLFFPSMQDDYDAAKALVAENEEGDQETDTEAEDEETDAEVKDEETDTETEDEKTDAEVKDEESDTEAEDEKTDAEVKDEESDTEAEDEKTDAEVKDETEKPSQNKSPLTGHNEDVVQFAIVMVLTSLTLWITVKKIRCNRI